MREILEEIVHLRSATDPNLHYLDGLRLFGERDLDELPDALHPSPEGYQRMGERFAAAAFAPSGPFAGASR
jgi:lysophospholipase L1-like esterase